MDGCAVSMHLHMMGVGMSVCSDVISCSNENIVTQEMNETSVYFIQPPVPFNHHHPCRGCIGLVPASSTATVRMMIGSRVCAEG